MANIGRCNYAGVAAALAESSNSMTSETSVGNLKSIPWQTEPSSGTNVTLDPDLNGSPMVR